MPNIVNKLLYSQLSDAFANAEGMVFFAMNGLTMQENEVLRGKIFTSGAELRVVRNRVALKALSALNLEVERDTMRGNVAIAWGNAEAAISVAKVVDESPLKKKGKLDVRGGVLEGNVLNAADAAALANVPDRPTLQAMLLGAISGPARSLVTVLNGNQSAIARVIQARIDAEGGAEG